MYDNPYAPEGMGREYINADGVRRPLADYVGASEEFNLGAYFGGESKFEPWDPFDFCKLSKVSQVSNAESKISSRYVALFNYMIS